MSLAASRRLLAIWLLASAHQASSQCYDLTATRLFEARSRFEEDWDRPMWNAKPGDRNFHVENEGYGRAHQFAIFTVGVVRRRPEGWVPYHASRTPRPVRCAHNAQGSGILCYNAAYEPVPEQAVLIVGHDRAKESWSLSTQGILTYRHSVRGRQRLIENRSPERVDPRDFRGEFYTQEDTATLDLNTGEYRYVQRGFCDGCNRRRFQNGLKLWRTIQFQARARLREVSCPATPPPAAGMALRGTRREAPGIDQETRGVCALRVKAAPPEGQDAVPKEWEFLQNPFGQAKSEGCVWVFAGRDPNPPKAGWPDG